MPSGSPERGTGQWKAPGSQDSIYDRAHSWSGNGSPEPCGQNKGLWEQSMQVGERGLARTPGALEVQGRNTSSQLTWGLEKHLSPHVRHWGPGPTVRPSLQTRSWGGEVGISEELEKGQPGKDGGLTLPTCPLKL